MSAIESSTGRIITFYSYKGGTGRSMAVANLACWLARRAASSAERTLVMDWDLEAPGLHRFFSVKAELPDNKDRPGVIDYFDTLQKILEEHPDFYKELTSDEGWKVLDSVLPLDDYIIADVIPGVDLLKAGRFDSNYPELINTFNWINFYNKFGAIIQTFRNLIESTYAYCLIDSRTGFTDVSGICTMLLPERVVTVFTPNRQSLSGVLDLAVRAADYRRTSNDFRPLSIFPLPSRIENAELSLKTEWRTQYQSEFEHTFREIYQLEECDLTNYFDEVQLPYVGYYAYGEKIALLEERSDTLSLARAYEVFFQRAVDLDFAWDKLEETKSPVTPAPAPKADDYEYDIYISYAHLDNKPLDEGMKGWVDLLQERLRIRLGQLLGYEAKIWRDIKLQGNDAFSEQVLNRTTRSKLFIAILSPRYIRSEWCLHELQEFYNSAELKGDLKIEGRSRMFKVLKYNIPRDQHPPQTQNILGYEFFEYDQVSGRSREFNPELTPNRDMRYWEKLDDLAFDIKNALETIRDASAKSVPNHLSAASSKTIYLAETTSDLNEERDKIKRELQQNGHHVLPDKALPLDGPIVRQVITDYISRSDFSIHLIGALYGIIPEGETRSLVQLQYDLAAERDDYFQRIIWMPRALTTMDRRQELFINELLLGDIGSSNQRLHLLQTSLEDLKIFIIDMIQSRRSKASLQGDFDQPVSVYIICDQQDKEALYPIERYLFDKGMDVLRLARDESDKQIGRLHKENLLMCDAVLIYFGHASSLWARMKVRDLQKISAQRTRPFLATAIYISGPESSEKDIFRSLMSLIIRNYGEFNPEVLQPFLELIKRARE